MTPPAEIVAPPAEMPQPKKKLRFEMIVAGGAQRIPRTILEVDSEEEAIDRARRRAQEMSVRHGVNGLIYIYPQEITQVTLKPAP